MSAPLPSAVRSRFQRLIEEGLSRRAAALSLNCFWQADAKDLQQASAFVGKILGLP